jgi:hypothetical protein
MNLLDQGCTNPQAIDRRGHWILYGSACCLWVDSVERASCHPSGA